MNDTNDHNNGNKIYDYSYHLFQEASKQIDKFSQRIITIIGFNGILLAFILRLDALDRGLIITKLLSAIAVLSSLIFCLRAIQPKNSGSIYTPQALVDNLWYEKEESFNAFMIQEWEKATNEMEQVIAFKQKMISFALQSITFGAFFFGLNIALNLIVSFLNTL